MSIRNLDAVFRPHAIALIGASDRPNSVAKVIADNLSAAGFSGPILPVNPKHETVGGARCYPDVISLPLVPDLVVICTPAVTVPALIGDAARKGVRGAIVISAGFQEGGSEAGRDLEQEMLAAAKPHLLRIVGPNCLGVLSSPAALNASFAPPGFKKGNIAFVAQSGAIVTTILDWAAGQGFGFSHLVSLGDMADVDFGDMLDYLANDPDTNAILLYIEAVTQPRKFLSAARAAARLKPVIAIKAGRHEASARAAASHTGALAGVDAVYDAVFRRAGILRVQDLDDIFDAVETLAVAPAIAENDLAILTNGGGAGVLAVDSLLDAGGGLTTLSNATLAKLDAVLPSTWSHANPTDIIGDAPPQRYSDALRILLEAPETRAVLVLNCPTAVASNLDAARAIADTARENRKPVLTNWLGSFSAIPARQLLENAGLPTYETPTQAVRGFMHLVKYRQAQNALLEVPPSTADEFVPDKEDACKIIAASLASGETWLNPESIFRILQSYQIPAARVAMAKTPVEAGKHAKAFSVPVALKIVSPDILHKSDAGGVALGLEGAEAVETAANAMLKHIGQNLPTAKLEGFVVQEMISWPNAYELIVGMACDMQFGPFLLFGEGGTAVEVIADKAIGLPPLNLPLARDLIGQTRVYKRLQGYRDRPPAALGDIALTLVKLSQLICNHDEIIEFDINPLLANAAGVIAVDARIRVAASAQMRGARLSIRPYPAELERVEERSDLGLLSLRPIRPEDAPELERFIEALSPEDARLRFFTPVRSMEIRALARFTQIDYEREMAFVLERQNAADRNFIAVARLACDPDNIRGEFAVVVASDVHRHGIGRLMMNRLIDYARRRGTRELFGVILAENQAMLALCRALGFALQPSEQGQIVEASLAL